MAPRWKIVASVPPAACAKAGGHERPAQRKGHRIHQGLSHSQDAHGDRIPDIALELFVPRPEKEREARPDLAATRHHEDRQKVVDARGRPRGIVEHHMNRRQRLVEPNRYEGEESSGRMGQRVLSRWPIRPRRLPEELILCLGLRRAPLRLTTHRVPAALLCSLVEPHTRRSTPRYQSLQIGRGPPRSRSSSWDSRA